MIKKFLKVHRTALLVALVVALFAISALLFSRAGVIDIGPLLKGDISAFLKKPEVLKKPDILTLPGATDAIKKLRIDVEKKP